jgi:ribonucleotide monophosphatase NagD (HAD superfamily)
MNTKDFLSQIQNSKNVICVDFDGVLHNDNLGFHDGTIYGNPIDGALEFIEKISKQYTIIIYTCKANPNRPLINGKTGIDLIWEWLEKYKIKQYIHDITFQKPHALAYVDDKAIKFENWNQTYKEINLLK